MNASFIKYVIGTLCAIRLAYLFFLASPLYAMTLSNILLLPLSFLNLCVPNFLRYLFTLANVLTASSLGDYLAVLVDSVFYALKLFTRLRFYLVCAYRRP